MIRARKSALVVDGDIVRKRVSRDNPLWRWYFARELAVYRAFASTPPPIRVPRSVAIDAAELAIERIDGDALGAKRSPFAELSRVMVERLVEQRLALATYAGVVEEPPMPPIRGQLRERLLEDPTAPVEWIVDGIARCVRRRLLPDAAPLVDAIRACAPIAFSHGDMLLRNIVGPEAVLVDWECAGMHVHDWDLALLYTQLAPTARAPIDSVIGGGARRAAFRALVAFAFARELRFLDAFPNPPAATVRRVRAELALVSA